MTEAYINAIETAVPDYDIHRTFIDHAPSLLPGTRERAAFRRMAERAQIEHRYSFLRPANDGTGLDQDGFYGATPPTTADRMRMYKAQAMPLAIRALDRLGLEARAADVTHLIVTSCTGFYAPGLDLDIVRHYGLRPSVERTIVGFMGCHAALHALKLARHIVRGDRGAVVAIVNIELCTLHLQADGGLEQVLSYLIFADGCAASLVSADASGLELQSFHACILPDSGEQITWHIGDSGFDMMLSGRVPRTIMRGVPVTMFGGRRANDIDRWAVHPGGRSVLDAVEKGIGLPPDALETSRDILRRYGNMSSPSIMFVLRSVMQDGRHNGQGCALAFGPGLSVESLMFGGGR